MELIVSIIGVKYFALNNEIYETMLCNSTNYLLEVGRSYNDSNISIYANPDILLESTWECLVILAQEDIPLHQLFKV